MFLIPAQTVDAFTDPTVRLLAHTQLNLISRLFSRSSFLTSITVRGDALRNKFLSLYITG